MEIDVHDTAVYSDGIALIIKHENERVRDMILFNCNNRKLQSVLINENYTKLSDVIKECENYYLIKKSLYNTSQQQFKKVDFKPAVKQEDYGKYKINAVFQEYSSAIYEQVTINNIFIEFMIDTRAKVNLINHKHVKKNPKIVIHETDKKLFSYNNDEVSILGYVLIKFDKLNASSKFYITNHDNIIKCCLAKELKLIEVKTVQQINNVFDNKQLNSNSTKVDVPKLYMNLVSKFSHIFSETPGSL
ncbi:hypothetical protein A3Q56_08083, partial [Intoshia linei]